VSNIIHGRDNEIHAIGNDQATLDKVITKETGHPKWDDIKKCWQNFMSCLKKCRCCAAIIGLIVVIVRGQFFSGSGSGSPYKHYLIVLVQSSKNYSHTWARF